MLALNLNVVVIIIACVATYIILLRLLREPLITEFRAIFA